ncbi:hypothetical protein AWN90_04390 [Nocardia terpenica]|uniref:Uncharacterized protein n=1 Tax=Nocardia terpenica TaxID=455432 RepID=A0A164IY86_9NOCA|nr:hypothetical protein AWN90_04390 [Nocardia terpenica]
MHPGERHTEMSGYRCRDLCIGHSGHHHIDPRSQFEQIIRNLVESTTMEISDPPEVFDRIAAVLARLGELVAQQGIGIRTARPCMDSTFLGEADQIRRHRQRHVMPAVQ